MTSTETPQTDYSRTDRPGVVRRKLIPATFATLVLAGGAAIPAASRASDTHTPAPPPPARQAFLINMVREDCGSCHGSRLTGGLGPPLTSAALRGKNLRDLEDTILFGRPGTPMPPWRPFLSRSEAEWIVRLLVKGFPDAPL